MNNTAVVVMTSTMDILMEDDLVEDTLLMEKASLLLKQQQPQHCSSSLDLGLCKTTSLNSKLVLEEEELDEIPLMVKSQPQQATKPKKNVRFLPDSQLTQIEYLTPRSARMMERLFYSDDDMQLLLHQLQCDVTAYERGDAYECDSFSVRGLERRTHQGSAQRARWRKLCRTVVLDEQDRQWAILPVEEPVDEQRIAFVSLEVTHKAKQLARKRAIQDELDIHAELQTQQQQQGMDVSCMTDGTAASFHGSSSSLRHCNCVEDSSRQHHHQQQQLHNCPTHPNNDKPRRRVHFPSSSRQMVEVFEYQHVATDQERHALWDPYLSLDDAKLQCASQIAILEQQQGLSSSSHDDDNQDDTTNDSTRGLESRTTLAETATEQLRSELRKALRFHPLDPVLFTKTCQKLSAKSRKQARSRGLMDQRAVKAFCFNDASHTALKTPTKKLVTRVPKKMVRTTSPPMDTGSKRSPPSSPTTCARSTKGKQSLSSSLHSDHGSSHGTVKRGSPLTAKMAVPKEEQEQVPEEQPRAKRTIDVPCPLPGTTKPQPSAARVRRVSDWSVGTVDTMDSTLFSSSNSTLTFQLPSGSLSSMSQVTAMDDDEDDDDNTQGEELDQVCRSSKPTRRSTMPDLSTALGLFVVPAAPTAEPMPRRHSSAMYRLSKVTEDNDDDDEDSEEEEEASSTTAGIPKSVMIGIPNKYFGRNSKSCIQNHHNSKAVAMLTNLEDSIKGQAYNQRSGDLPETDEDMDNDSTMLAESFHHDNDDDHKGGDGSGRLSGIIGRLWEKRRQGGLVRNETMTMNDSAL